MTAKKAKLLDGAALAKDRIESIRQKFAALPEKITLATVQVGTADDVTLYRKYLEGLAKKNGFHLAPLDLKADISERDLIKEISRLNADRKVTGVMIFSPLPKALNRTHVFDALDPRKDVEGRTFLKSHYGVFSPTANAAVTLIESTGRKLNGLNAVVIGHSDLVGKPTAVLLMDKMATVTVCHVETRNLAVHVAAADIVVAAVGKPDVIKGAWIKPGAIVIDVGENVVGGKILGDVEFESASRRADFISPVPGGVGPLTNVMLLENLLRLHEIEKRRNGNP